jgi:hypothetical protein
MLQTALPLELSGISHRQGDTIPSPDALATILKMFPGYHGDMPSASTVLIMASCSSFNRFSSFPCNQISSQPGWHCDSLLWLGNGLTIEPEGFEDFHLRWGLCSWIWFWIWNDFSCLLLVTKDKGCAQHVLSPYVIEDTTVKL